MSELLYNIFLALPELWVALASLVIVWLLRDTSRWRKLKMYVLVLGVLNALGYITGELSIHNWWLYQIIGLAELLWTYPVYRALGLPSWWRYIHRSLVVLYLVDAVVVWNAHRIQQASNLEVETYLENPIGQSLTFIFILMLGFSYLYQVYKKAQEDNLLQSPAFLINAGFMIYASQAFYAFLISTEILKEEVDIYFFDAMWLCLGLGNLIKYTLLIISAIRIRNGINAN